MIEHGGGDVPDELVDFLLCKEMGWTWQELQDTPLYVRTAWWLFLQMQHAAAAQQADDQRHAGMEVTSHA